MAAAAGAPPTGRSFDLAVNAFLRLSSRGEALIAELLRLSDHIPPLFLLQDKQDQKLYGDVLLDFRYLKTPELFEHRIESSPEFVTRDEDIWEIHGDVIERFFSLFESIYKYVKDFARCLEDLREGVYIQQTLEGVLLDEDGKQLICEVLYLYGVMLLLMDSRIEGAVRERMLIAYYRHKGASSIDSIEDVFLLVRATGFSANTLDRNGLSRRPQGYPEEFFERMPRRLGISGSLVHMMVARLRSEDMYGQISSYPLPQHRSVALATQARMLYVLLYFVPEVLEDEPHTMREIVDRHFADNWVIAYYMGFTVELPHAWDAYKAARAALTNTVQPANIKSLHANYIDRLGRAKKMLQRHLTEGVLTDEFALDNTPELLHTVRECNVTIRWLMLHRTARFRRLPETADVGREAEQLLLLVMSTAQLEYSLRSLFSGLLDAKEDMWQTSKKQAHERLSELAEFFSGEKALTRVARDEQLVGWFQQLASQVEGLDSNDATLAGRKMHHLIAALSEVEQFHQLEQSLQITQFLAETRALLSRMIRVVNIRDNVLVTLSVVSDMAYAWEVINNYTALMRQRIQRDPFCVLKLRATFLKLVSILDAPLVRINQANSPDLASVSQYYSAELVAYVRRVLQVIPENLFSILNEIVNIQTHELIELPGKVARAELREWSQLEPRHQLARATHRVSVLTEGVLNMQTTLLGVIKVDPKELLHDGIRRELVRQVTIALDAGLVFRSGKPQDVEMALAQLTIKLEGFQLSLEYISDYVKITGVQLWQQEFSRVIAFFVEQECNGFLKRSPPPSASKHQNTSAPIAYAPQGAGGGAAGNFIGRLVRELLHVASTRRTTYSEALSAWCDDKGREVVGARTAHLLHRAMGCLGLAGMHRVLGFVVVQQLSEFGRAYGVHVAAEPLAQLQKLAAQLEPAATLPEKLPKLFAAAGAGLSRFWPELLDTVCRCGTAQLLRRHLAHRLASAGRLDASLLTSMLRVGNEALIVDVSSQLLAAAPVAAAANAAAPPPPSASQAAATAAMVGSLSPCLDAAGVGAAHLQVFVTSEALPLLPLVLALFTAMQVPRMAWSSTLATLASSGKSADEAVDGVPFAVGVATLLRQHHRDLTIRYLALLGQYVRAQLHAAFSQTPKPLDNPPEVATMLQLLETFCHYAEIDEHELPPYLAQCLPASRNR